LDDRHDAVRGHEFCTSRRTGKLQATIMEALFRQSKGFGGGGEPAPRFERRMKRNCSLTPKQTMAALAILAGFPLAVAAAFGAVTGVWLVLPFAVAHAIFIMAALHEYAIHSCDEERLMVVGDLLIVEVDYGGTQRSYRMRRSRTLITYRDDGMICFEDEAHSIELGHHIGARERAQFALEIATYLDA
jgi:uncharacterized membrane protein